jgi:hypothetical protein
MYAAYVRLRQLVSHLMGGQVAANGSGSMSGLVARVWPITAHWQGLACFDDFLPLLPSLRQLALDCWQAA